MQQKMDTYSKLLAGTHFFDINRKVYLKYDVVNKVLVHTELIYGGMWYADVVSFKKTVLIINSSKSGNAIENRSIEFINMVFI